MIWNIKNKHLRRLALFVAVPFSLLISPFDAWVEYYPEYFRQLIDVTTRCWNKP